MARAARVQLPDGSGTWATVDEAGLPIEASEVFLDHHRVYGSPNTVRHYATSLGFWFTYLSHAGVSWREAGRLEFGGFVRYLRRGDVPGVVALPGGEQIRSESTVATRIAAVTSFYAFHAARGEQSALSATQRVSSRHREPAFRGFLDHAKRSKYSRMAQVNVRRAHSDRPPILTPEECRDIFDACAVYENNEWHGSLRNRFLFELMCESGLRLGEALSLQHGDFHLGRGGTPRLEVTPRTTPHGVRVKSGHRRSVYVSTHLEQLYADYLWSLCELGWDQVVDDPESSWLFVGPASTRFAPVSPSSIYDAVRRLKRRTQRKDWTPHWFRHTHATALLLAGQPEILVSRRLGHAQIQTTLNLYGWVTRDAELQALSDWQGFTAAWLSPTELEN